MTLELVWDCGSRCMFNIMIFVSARSSQTHNYLTYIIYRYLIIKKCAKLQIFLWWIILQWNKIVLLCGVLYVVV